MRFLTVNCDKVFAPGEVALMVQKESRENVDASLKPSDHMEPDVVVHLGSDEQSFLER